MKKPSLGSLGYLLVAVLCLGPLGCKPASAPLSDTADTKGETPAVTQTNLEERAEAPTDVIPVQKIALPPDVDRVVEMSQARVAESVILEYVKSCTNCFELSSEQIVYLTDLGLSEQVMTALVRRSNELRDAADDAMLAEIEKKKERAAPAKTAPVEEATPPPAAVVTQEAPPPPPEIPPVETTQRTEIVHHYWYSTLAPYGSWIVLPSYGWCWQPTCAMIDLSWRPYCDRGHWAYTDYGWYWASDYSWGWGPFHYGRWRMHPGRGWVWMPGSVWGPAWVTWRHQGAYCGWAPLPPEAHWDAGVGLTFHGSAVSLGFGFGLGARHYSFAHCGRLEDRLLSRHCLGKGEANQVYNRSTVVNNVIIGNNNTIVNNGIGTELVKNVTRQEVKKVELRDVNGPARTPYKPDSLSPGKNWLAVYRPKVPPDYRTPPGSRQPAKGIEPPIHTLGNRQEARKDTPTEPVRAQRAQGQGTAPVTALASAPMPRNRNEAPAAAKPGIEPPAGAEPRGAGLSTSPSGKRVETQPSQPARTTAYFPRRTGETARPVRALTGDDQEPMTRTGERVPPSAGTRKINDSPERSAAAPRTIRTDEFRTPRSSTVSGTQPSASVGAFRREADMPRGELRKIELPAATPASPPKFSHGVQAGPGRNTGLAAPPAAPSRSLASPAPSRPAAPTFAPSPRPSMSAPPARSFSAPAPAPSRSFASPAPAISSPPARSSPAPSAPARSQSGGGPGGRYQPF